MISVSAKLHSFAICVFLVLLPPVFGQEQSEVVSENIEAEVSEFLTQFMRSKDYFTAIRSLKSNTVLWNSDTQTISDKLASGIKLKIYNFLGVLAAQKHYYDDAVKYYELAWEQVKHTNDPRQLTALLENYAASLVRTHQYQKAAGYFRLISLMYQKMKLTIPRSVKNNMGTNSFMMGDYEKALSHHLEAAGDLLRNLKKADLQNEIIILYNVAWDYCAMGKIPEAVDYLNKIKKQVPEAMLPFLQCRILYLKSMVSPLDQVKNDLLSFEKNTPSGADETEIFITLTKAEIGKRENHWLDVAKNLISALKLQHPDFIKQVNVKELPPGIQTYKARCAAIAEAFAKAGDQAKAWLWIQKANLRAETDLTIKGKTDELADVMSIESKLASGTCNADEILKLEQVYEQAKQQLKKSNHQLWQALFSQRINLHPDDLDQIRHVLPSQVMLLEVAVIGNNIAFFICEQSCPVKMVLLPMDKAERKLKRMIMQFRQTISSPGDPAIAKELCFRLYGMLFKPVEKEIQKLQPRLILYSPTGILRYIPIAALHTGKSFLGEKYLFCNLSGYDLLRVNKSARTVPLEKFVGFANPDETLPASEKECDSISRLFPHQIVFKRSSATKNKFLQLSGAIDCLHVATHGVLDPSAPEKSRIIFADQPLTYSEMVAGLPFMKQLYMLTFSACNTASVSGLNENAMEIYGIAYQFIRKSDSGATLATLWPVSDTHTQLLMEKFYQSLLAGQKNQAAFNRASALHEAQMHLLQHKETAHPFYWAPFILIGNFN